MRLLSLFVALLATSFAEVRAGAAPAAKPPHPIVILVSLDGFRWDYPEIHRPPNLLKLAAEGVRAERLVPQFPTLTFPNHYTIVTGLRPARHGIIANDMFDPEWNSVFRYKSPTSREARWWGGEPLWNTIERQGLVAACSFWPGSEAPIGDRRPTYWKTFDAAAANEPRIAEILSWLDLPDERRPSFITVYFADTDVAGHKHGPRDPRTTEVVLAVDRLLGLLVEGAAARGLGAVVNFIVLSDHGMTDGSRDKTLFIDDFVDVDAVQMDFSWELVGLRPREMTPTQLRDRFTNKNPHVHAYLVDELPARFQFRDNRRIPPVIVLPDPGWRVVSRATFTAMKSANLAGAHGYDPAESDMGAVFVARGPAFRRGATIGPVSNLDVYDLVCAILHLTPAPNDGTDALAKAALVSP